MPPLKRSQLVVNWLQSIAIVVAGIWIIGFELMYKDLWKSESDPIHITPSLKLEVGEAGEFHTPVKITLRLKNDSDTKVYFAPGMVTIWGSKIAPQAIGPEIVVQMSNAPETHFNIPIGQHPMIGAMLISAIQNLKDANLGPGELLDYSYMAYSPANAGFEHVEAAFKVWIHDGDRDIWSHREAHVNGPPIVKPCLGNRKTGCTSELDPENVDDNEIFDEVRLERYSATAVAHLGSRSKQ